MNGLYHHGVKGQKWGVRNGPPYPLEGGAKRSTPAGSDRKTRISPVHQKPAYNSYGNVVSKQGESVELHKNPTSITAKFLAKICPSLREKMEQYRDYTIKSKDGQKTVGNICVNRDSKDSLNIVWIGIKTKTEGNGYGQSAMRTIIDDAKKSGFKNVTLEVPTNSPNARHIYEKLGFKETGEAMLGSEDDVWGGLTKMRLDL